MAFSQELTRKSIDSPFDDSNRWSQQFQNHNDENPGQSNIWKKMSYIPPRGPCGFKYSVVSPACPCLRFMIHPIKAATSFECDGCNHHASFHQMRSPSEDQIHSRWLRQDGTFDREAYEGDEEVQEILAKRRRLGIEGEMNSNTELTMPGKARSTLVDATRKRSRSGKSSY